MGRLTIYIFIIFNLSLISFIGATEIKFDYQLPTEEELMLNYHPLAEEYGAITLSKTVYIHDELERAYELKYERIKILNDKGFVYGNIEIPYGDDNPVKELKARIVHPDGKVIELLPSEIREKEVIKGKHIKLKAKSFAFPSMVTGSIIEYIYKQKRGNYFSIYLPLQDRLPILKLKYIVRPNGYYLMAWSGFNVNSNISPKRIGDNVIIEAENIPAFKEEDNSPAEFDIKSSIVLFYTSKRYENSDEFWKEVANNAYELYSSFIKDKKSLREFLKPIIESNESQEEKLKKIYVMLQKKIRNLDLEDINKDVLEKRANNLKYVFKNLNATGNQINLAMVAAANLIGLQSYIGLTVDKRISKFYKEYPNANQLSSLIAVVKVGDAFKFLNPGAYGLPYGAVPWYYANEPVLLLGKNYEFIKAYFPTAEENLLEANISIKVKEDGETLCNEKFMYTGALSMEMRQDYKYIKDENKLRERHLEQLRNIDPSIKLDDLVISNIEDTSQPFIIERKYHYTFGQMNTNTVVYQLPIMSDLDKKLFSAGNKIHPFCIGDRRRIVYNIEVIFPDAYVVDSLPSNSTSKIDEAIFEISYTGDNNKMKIYRKLDWNFSCLPANRYSALKLFWEQVQSKDKSSIIFKKK